MGTVFSAIDDGFREELTAVESMVQAFVGSRSTTPPRTRVAASNAATLLLAALFEEYVREMAREFARLVVSNSRSIGDVPDRLVATAWKRTMNALEAEHKDVGPEPFVMTELRQKFDAVFAFCSGDTSQDIYTDLIHNENNMRHDQMNQLFKIGGLSSVCKKIASQTSMKAALGVQGDDEAYGQLRNGLEDFFTRRNEIAHSLEQHKSVAPEELMRDVAFFRAIGEGLCGTLEAHAPRRAHRLGAGHV